MLYAMLNTRIKIIKEKDYKYFNSQLIIKERFKTNKSKR